MTFIRNYVDKQATLIKNNNSNNSKNPVFEIVRGNGIYSRYIFSVDLVPLRNKLINEYGVASGSVETHKIKFYNAINLRNDLIGKQNVDGFYRDNNFELQLFKIEEDFDNGIFYNYNYNNISLTPDNIQVPNWYFKNENEYWYENGVFSGNTAPNILATQFLSQGNENLEFDITNTLVDIIYNTTATTLNLGISYSSNFENTITGNTENYIVSFFSKYTQTFFEPCLETLTNEVILDDRIKFYLDETNKLYLYPNKPINSVDKVEIYDFNEDLISTLSGNTDIIKVNNNTYYINLSVSSNDYPDMVNFTDKWYYTDSNNNNKTFLQEFTLLTDDLFLNSEEKSYLNSKFYFSTFGINNNETISQTEKKRRIQVITKRLFNSTIEDNIPIDHLQYRLYVLQGATQIEIIPFTNINKTFINNYFEIDVESLIPQTYYIEIKLNYNGITLNDSKTIKFKIASEK